MAALTDTIAQLHQDHNSYGNPKNNNEDGSVNHNQGGQNNHGGNTSGLQGGNNGGVQSRFVRLDFPRFNGEDPTGWIYIAEQFFHYHGIAAIEKVLLTSFHLQGEALQWYEWYTRNHTGIRWEGFTTALCVRFRPSDYEKFDEALAKLQQTGVKESHIG